MLIDLTGKTVVITGAARGIGLVIARTFAQEGATVLCVDRDRGSAEVTCWMIRDEADGPNGITRARILEVLEGKDDFTADGWMGEEPKDLRGMGTCMVMMQIEGGEFVRRFPEEEGTLDCDAKTSTR